MQTVYFLRLVYLSYGFVPSFRTADQEFHAPIIIFITEIFIAFKPCGLVKVQAAEFTRFQLNLEVIALCSREL